MIEYTADVHSPFHEDGLSNPCGKESSFLSCRIAYMELILYKHMPPLYTLATLLVILIELNALYRRQWCSIWNRLHGLK
jgi:hypothetical protein